MAQTAATTKRTSIQHACRTFAVSETCYRSTTTRPSDVDVIADWLVLTACSEDELAFRATRICKGDQYRTDQ